MIDVMIVDDSRTSQELMTGLLDAQPGMRVSQVARDGQQALACMANSPLPHVVVMDINMPHLDGYETTRRILEQHPVPIIICSSIWQPDQTVACFRAMEVGAVTAVAKPPGPGHPEFDRLAADFVRTVRIMSEVRVVRRWTQKLRAAPAPVSRPRGGVQPGLTEVVVMGASTGGPQTIQVLLNKLVHPFPLPIVIVQHICNGFLEGLVTWLEQTVPMPVRVATQGAPLVAGQVYFAPDGMHAGLRQGRVVLDANTQPEAGLRPSVSYLFRSTVVAYGPRAVGVLLTGMGRDGAEALRQMRDAGALTLVQDRESSVVHGMPDAAIRLGAACHVLSPEDMATMLNGLQPFSAQRIVP
ncbi:MAG: response regulator [Magnetococcales bacterium]|nr:response regulator [Magnetococcales bacterium]